MKQVLSNSISDCFVVLDKPPGISSQQAVQRVKRILGVKKAGHTGTLDPLATGVLPIALGEATKIIPFLNENQKVYQVQGKLGMATDTYDSEGAPQQQADPSAISHEQLATALNGFRGEIEQVPPRFSALKIQGRPAYQYARRGLEISMEPRQISITALQLLSFHLPFFELQVVCSKGTYIRSLIHDLGLTLGCYGHLTSLRRLKSGPFSLERAVTLETLENESNFAREKSWSMEECLQDLPRIDLIGEETKQVSSGVRPTRIGELVRSGDFKKDTIALYQEGKVLALIAKNIQKEWAYARVLNSVFPPPLQGGG